jgi:aminopeptidase N
MQPYILAIVVSDFKHVEDVKNKQMVFARSRAILDGEADFALEAGVKVLRETVEYVGIRYTMLKMDQVAMPNFLAGAMENWGLVIYLEELLLYNVERHHPRQRAGVVEIIGHEFGHQFFGNHVAPKWWSYLWLNEGFATLLEFIATDLAYPSLEIEETFLIKKLHVAFASDSKPNTRPMTSYVEDPQEISSLFDDISYSRGEFC